MASIITRCVRTIANHSYYNAHAGLYILPFIFIVLLVAFILITICPTVNIPANDSGNYLYNGQQILHHRLLYKDMFDQKGPVISYIDAFGLLIGHNSVWGVWIIEVLFLTSATYFGFRLLQIHFSTLVAYWVSFLWLLSLTKVLQSGNLTEEYAIPLQLLCLFLLYQYYQRGFSIWRAIIIGSIAIILFFLRPNLVGVPAAIMIYSVSTFLFSREMKWSGIKLIGGMVLGSTIVAAIILGYLGYLRVLPYFWDCAFIYNFSYSQSSVIYKVDAFLYGLEQLPIISSLSIFAWCIVLYLRLSKRLPVLLSSPVVIVCIIVLPIEFVLSSVSGRRYPHYFMTWLPSMAILSGITAYIFFKQLRRFCIYNNPYAIISYKNVIAIGLLTIVPLLPISRLFLQDIFHRFPVVAKNKFVMPTNPVAEYVTENTDDDDTVLVLGGTYSWINFLSHRQAPTRHAGQMALYDVISRPKYIQEFIRDVNKQMPMLIIESPEVTNTQSKYWSVQGMSSIKDILDVNYYLIETITNYGQDWRIFKLREDMPENRSFTDADHRLRFQVRFL